MSKVAMESWHGDYGADAGGYRVLEFDGKPVGRVDDREAGKELVEYVATLEAQLTDSHTMLDKCFTEFPGDPCATCRDHSLPWRIAKLDGLRENQLAEAEGKLAAMGTPLSDEEYETHYGHGGEDGRPKLCDRLDVDRIIAARTNQPQTKKETKA